MKTRDTIKALRAIFAGDRSTIPIRSPEWSEYQALYRFTQSMDEDDARTLDAFRLLDLVIDVLFKGISLADAGRQASGDRYATEVQARAYAVAQMHVAARILDWNQREYAPHRRAASEAARRLCAQSGAVPAGNNAH